MKVPKRSLLGPDTQGGLLFVLAAALGLLIGGMLRRRRDLARRTAAGVLLGKRDLP